MKSLSEFLNEQAEKQDSDSATRKKDRDDWVSSVHQLMGQLEGWLRQADGHGILEIEQRPYERREEKVGHYVVFGLTVRLGAREVQIVPIARSVVAASTNALLLNPQGRVDITDGETRYSLYRVCDTPAGRWVIVDKTGGLSGLDQTRFEAAILDLLG